MLNNMINRLLGDVFGCWGLSNHIIIESITLEKINYIEEALDSLAHAHWEKNNLKHLNVVGREITTSAINFTNPPITRLSDDLNFVSWLERNLCVVLSLEWI